MKDGGLKITAHKSRLAIAVVLLVSVLCCSLMVYTLFYSGKQAKAYLAGYDDSNIMTDFVMSNTTTMSERNIWDFLHSKNPCNDRNLAKAVKGYHYNIRDGHFVCMADEMFSGQTTSHIIWQAAQDYRINPQVLLVVLEKEQRLISDTFPSNLEYNHATGFNCPDDGKGCRPEHAGFINQVRSAAAFFREVLDGGWSNYPAYETSNILYHPNRSCGSKRVYVANRATSALYRYTPYVPNQAALRANWGYGDACSAYGNRNFYNMFTNWFGSTRQYDTKGAIRERYNQIAQQLGQPTNAEYCPEKDTCWQDFRYGVIIWHEGTGAWESKGGIRERWARMGYQGGAMGYPTGPEVWDGQGWWQNYERGAIVGTAKLGFWESKGGIRERWVRMGYQGGAAGYPTGPEVWDGQGWWQNYERGAIVGTTKTGFWESKGGIRERWAKLGWQGGAMGYPTGPEVWDGRGWWQNYERGAIVGTAKTGFWESKGGIRGVWHKIGWQGGKAGYPISQEYYDGNKSWHQDYEHGTIYFSDYTGGRFIKRENNS